jgi:predicted enzyme related to lactoylglutathione lyase
MLELRACIDVNDLDQGIAFYTQALGLTLGRRLGNGWAELLGAPSGSASPTASLPRSYRRHWTPVHLDFVVSELEAAVQRARSAGAVVEKDIEETQWGRIALLADPFGHGFCLLEFRGQGYDELVETTDR